MTRRVSLGPTALKTVEEARRECHALSAEPPAAAELEAAARAVPVFRDFVAGRWKEVHFDSYKPSTQRGVRHVLDRQLLPAFGSKPLDGITPARIGRWFHAYNRVAGARAQAGESLDELRRALGFDRDAAALLAEWRAHERDAGNKSAEDIASRIGALEARAAPGEMPGALVSAVETIAEWRREEEERRRWEEDARRRQAEARAREEAARQRVETDAREALARQEALTGERNGLLGKPLLDRAAGLSGWRGRAEPAVAAARDIATDPSLPSDLREALSVTASELDRALRFDREAAALHADWERHGVNARKRGVHPFHAPGSEDVAERIAALAEKAIRPDEVPQRLTKALADHRTMAGEWREIERCRETLARLAAHPDPGSEDWRRDASGTAAKADAILADERMCRDHALDGTALGGEMADRAALLSGALRIHDASEGLLRDWRAHVDTAAEREIHPFHAPGYGGLVKRIERHASEAGDRMPGALVQVLKDHERLQRSHGETRRLAKRLDGCLNKRDELLGRAEEKLDPRHPVAGLGGPHRRWRRGVSGALEAGRALLDDDRYAPHLDALGGRARIERAVARLERAARLDRLPAGAVRAWEALEDRVRETGRHRFFLPEHERACRLMSHARDVRDKKARAFVGKELRLRERMGKEAKELRDAVERLRKRQAEREEAQAGEAPFVRQEGYGQWWADAWGALQDAKPLLEKKEDFALHFAEDPSLGEDLETLTASFEEVLPEEREQRRRVLAEDVREEQSREQRRNISQSRGFRM